MKAIGKRGLAVLVYGCILLPRIVTGQGATMSTENQDSSNFDIKTAVERALSLNTNILSARASVEAAEFNKKRQFTEFLPKFSTRYSYTRRDDEQTIPGFVVTPRDQYQFAATVDQPVFSGFSRKTQYEIAGLDLQIQQLLEKQTRQDLVLTVKEAYFTLLQTEKLDDVAEESVKQLAAQVQVAEDFYNVGMVPKNDVLEAEVDLANARQELIVAKNDVEVARSRFNTILRRPVDAPVHVKDMLSYEPFHMEYQAAVETSLERRTEITLANREVKNAQKDIVLAKTGYFPAVDLQGNYFRTGDDPSVDGGAGITDSEEWDMRVVFFLDLLGVGKNTVWRPRKTTAPCASGAGENAHRRRYS